MEEYTGHEWDGIIGRPRDYETDYDLADQEDLDELEDVWEQMSDLPFFDYDIWEENLGKRIIITIPKSDLPELINWQYQLKLANENKADFEVRSGIKDEDIIIPAADSICIALYVIKDGYWYFFTEFTKYKEDLLD